MRILVTGSRDWPDEPFVRKVLKDYLGLDDPANFLDDDVIVHGHCPTGADKFADSFAYSIGMVPERHPANWAKYRKGAGPKRNQKMVDLGADVVLAFLMPGSKGTVDCIQKAQKAGLPVVIHELTPMSPDLERYTINTYDLLSYESYAERKKATNQ